MMTKKDFIQKMQSYGIHLETLSIDPDGLTIKPDYLGVCKVNDLWTVYQIVQNSQINLILRTKNEDKAFTKLYQEVMQRLNDYSIVNADITLELVKQPKSLVTNWLKKDYKMSDQDANDAFDYLAQDLRVLCEAKYFAKYHKFVPERSCWKFYGYSAEKIFKTTHLSEIGAINYLIYLLHKPKDALHDLKMGLPIR